MKIIIPIAVILITALVQGLAQAEEHEIPDPDIKDFDFPATIPGTQIMEAFPNVAIGNVQSMLSIAHNDSEAYEYLKPRSDVIEVLAPEIGIGAALTVVLYPEKILSTYDRDGQHAWIATDRPALVLHEVTIKGGILKLDKTINITARQTDNGAIGIVMGGGVKKAAFTAMEEYRLDQMMKMLYDNETFVGGGINGNISAVDLTELKAFFEKNRETLIRAERQLNLTAEMTGRMLQAMGMPESTLFCYTDGEEDKLGIAAIEGSGIRVYNIALTKNGANLSSLARFEKNNYEPRSILRSKNIGDRKFATGWVPESKQQ